MAHTFSGQRVIVTGASRGIGLATAQAFVRQGAHVALVARERDHLEQVVTPLGERAAVVVGDTSDPEDCRQIVLDATRELGGPIDVLVSNAGILRRDFVEDVTVTDFEESYRTNVGGALWLSQAVIPSMRERGYGRIVLVASELGLIGAPSYASYCMSKFAMVALGEVLSHELAQTGVRAAVVCPGNVLTEQFREENAWGPAAGATADKALAPETVAETILAAAAGSAVVVLADRPATKLSFDALFAMPRSLRLRLVRDAYKPLLADRRRRLAGGGGPA